MDETGADYTECSKPERKTPIQYTNTYMEFRKLAMTTLYARQEKRHSVYNGLLDSEGEGQGGMIWENGIETCILSCKN